MAAHSTLGASSSDRWMTCSGSIRLSEGMPNKSSSYAREGTAAHEIAAEALELGLTTQAREFLGRVVKVEDEDFEVTEEMVEAIQVYLDAVRAVFELGDIRFVEHRFDLSNIFPGMFGTNDCGIYSRNSQVLHVFDFKYGRGIAVDVVDNSQLKYYGIGALQELGTLPVKMVRLWIVQPRAYHTDGAIRHWDIDPLDLTMFAAELIAAAKKTEAKDATLVAGDHCQFCPAAGVCPKLRETALATARLEFSTNLPATVGAVGADATPADPRQLEPSTLARILDRADVVEEWIKAVRAHAHDLVRTGVDVPGWKLVDKRATRSWTRDDADIAALLEANGVDPYNKKILSPAQAEKALPKAKRDAVKQFITSNSSGTNLVRAADSTPASIPRSQSEFTPVGVDKGGSSQLPWN